NAQTITCSFAHLAKGATKSITVQYHVAASTAPGSVSNTASATSDEVSTAATGTASVTVETHADLSTSKTAPSQATAGDPSGFNYVVTVHNGGPSDNTGG